MILRDGSSLVSPLSGVSFLEQFATWADRVPLRTAVRDNHRKLTFKELDTLSAAVAARLRAFGLGGSTTSDHYDIDHPEKAAVSPWIILHTGRTVDVAVGIIGTLRAGGAYICVPAGAPETYIRRIMETSHVTAVLTDDADRSSWDGVPCIHLSDAALISEKDVELAASSYQFVPHPRDIATAIFTSGSTGMPKGVVLEHLSLSEMLAWQQDYMELGPGDHTAAFAPFGFIASLWEVLFPLASGMTLHILDEDVRRDPLALEKYFGRHAIRYVFLSPEMAELFSHNCRGESLRYVRVAGGALRSCPSTPYEILYSLGMSENGGSVTFLSIQQAYEDPIPLGGAFGPTRIYLVDRENRLVTQGQIGRMAVSSPSLARGYLGMPEENAAHFIVNSHNGNRGAIFNREYPAGLEDKAECLPAYDRIFLSDDLARLGDHGMLVHCGRRDFVVKIRGMRVEPGHTEAALSGCRGVKECVVVARPAHDQGHRLLAWAVGDKLEEDRLRDILAECLPDYMMPERIMIVDALPRGINGKVDRSRLPDIPLHNSQRFGVDQSSEPRLFNLCALFADILNLPAVGPDDNFFVCGGDSLKLARLQLRLRGEWFVDLPYRDLFHNPSPRATLELLDTAKRSDAVEPILKKPERSEYPLPPPMRQMFLLWRLGPDQRAYEVNTCILIEGKIDEDRFERAFAAMVQQEPILRSYFVEQDGEPVWRIKRNLPYTLVHAHASDPKGARQIWETLNDDRPPFDLSHCPLFFAARIDAGPDRCFIGLATHHILADALSLRLLMDRWWRLYAFDAEEPSAGESVGPVAITDVALWDQGRVDRPSVRRAEAYWQQMFDSLVSPLTLAGSRPRPSRLNGSSVAAAILEKDQSQRLSKVARDRHTTAFQIMLAVWTAFLSKLSKATKGFDEVVIGVPFAGREYPELQDCVGMFVRTLPLRFGPRADGAQTFAAWLDEANELFLTAWEHQSCSLERIVQMVKPRRIPGRGPLYDVMINHFPEPRPFPAIKENSREVRASAISGFAQRPMFDLILEIKEQGDHRVLELVYAKDLFLDSLVRTWAVAIADIAVAVAEDPEIRLRELPWPDMETDIKADEKTGEVGLSPKHAWDEGLPFLKAVLDNWKQVLGVKTPTPEDDFFDLGGDSIKAMRLEAKLFNAGWYLPATEIYERARLGELMNVVVPINCIDEEEDEFA